MSVTEGIALAGTTSSLLLRGSGEEGRNKTKAILENHTAKRVRLD